MYKTINDYVEKHQRIDCVKLNLVFLDNTMSHLQAPGMTRVEV